MPVVLQNPADCYPFSSHKEIGKAQWPQYLRSIWVTVGTKQVF